MNIPWDLVIEAILDAIALCMDEGLSDSQVIANARNLGPIARLRIRGAIMSRTGWDRATWVRNRDEVFAGIDSLAKSASEGDWSFLCSQARLCCKTI